MAGEVATWSFRRSKVLVFSLVPWCLDRSLVLVSWHMVPGASARSDAVAAAQVPAETKSKDVKVAIKATLLAVSIAGHTLQPHVINGDFPRNGLDAESCEWHLDGSGDKRCAASCQHGPLPCAGGTSVRQRKSTRDSATMRTSGQWQDARA